MARKSRKETVYRTSEVAAEKKDGLYRAGLYSRISVETADKINRDTIGTQMEFLRTYALSMTDAMIEEEYVDDDITGTNFERPEFERMMNDIRCGRINCVIVKDLSRFGREHILTGEYLEKIFPELGVRFIAINDNVDTLTSDGGIVVPFMNYINERYAKDASIKIKSHFKVMQMTGAYCSSHVPYGYRRSDLDKHKFVIDPKTEGVVRNIFEWYVEGISQKEIVRRLENDNIPSPAQLLYIRGEYKKDKFKDVRWCNRTIYRIVRNQCYCGDMVQNKYESDFELSGIKGQYVTHGKDEWIIVRNTHESIISRDMFDKAQERAEMLEKQHIEKCKKGMHDNKPEYLLTGVLRCGHCGKSINVKKHSTKAGPHYWYICPTHEVYGTERCPKKALDLDQAHDLVFHTLMRYMENFVDMQTAIRQVNSTDTIRLKRQEIQKKIQINEAELTKIKTMKSRLYADMTDGLIDELDYSYIGRQYDSQMQEKIKAIDNLKKQKALYDEQYSDGKIIEDKVSKFFRSEALTKEMVDAFLESIIVDNDGTFRIEMKCKDEYEAFMTKWIQRKDVEKYAG